MRQPFASLNTQWSVYSGGSAHSAVFQPFLFTTGINDPARAEQAVAVAGTIRYLRVQLIDGTSDVSRTITLWKNGAPTTLQVSFAAGSSYGEDLTNSVSVVAGDYVSFRYTSSLVDRRSRIAFEFVTADDFTSLYSCCGLTNGNPLTLEATYNAPLASGFWAAASLGVSTARESIVGVAGTLTAIAIRLEVAPGAGATRAFALYKNGVRQDGSGGTVDTEFTIANTDRQGSASFSLTVSPLDTLTLEATVTAGSPPNTHAGGTLAFVADNAGEFQLCGSPHHGLNEGNGTRYNLIIGRGNIWELVEDDQSLLGAIEPFTVTCLYVRQSGTLNTPDENAVFTVFYNGTSTDLTATIEAGDTFASVGPVTGVTLTQDDTWSMQLDMNAAASLQTTWTFTCVNQGSPSGSPSPGQESPPVERTPPTLAQPSPDECPCPPADGGAGNNPGGDPNAPPVGPGPGGGGSGNSGPNTGGEGWTPGTIGCDDGGTVNDYEPAEPGESMANVRDPRLWIRVGHVEFDDADVSTETPEDWALDATMPDVPHVTYGARKPGKMFTLSPIVRGMSDDNGNYVGSRVTAQLNDKVRDVLRTRMGSQDTKYVWDRDFYVYLASEANRRSGYATPPRDLHRGLTYDIAMGGSFTAAISSEDAIASQFGAFGPDRSFSSRLLTLGLLPGLPRDLVGKPQQWIYGEVSDEGAIDVSTGLPQSKGLVPLWLVGALGSEDEYHLAAHDIGGMILYGSNGATPPTRVQLTEGVDYRWETLDLTDSDTGLVHRVTHVYLPTGSVPTEAHKSGGVNLAANVCGKLGANGQTITDLFKIYQAVFELQMLPNQEYHTGPYPAGPFWTDGRAKILSDSFVEAQEFSIERIGGEGYKGAFVLGGPGNGAVTVRETLRRMSNSGDCWFTWTSAGQLKCVLLDDTSDLASTPILREPARLRALPTPRYAFEEVENPVIYGYDWDDDKRRFRVPQAVVVNQRALTRMGRPKPSPQPVEMRCVRDHMTARDVASRRLLRRQFPPAYVNVVEPIDGVDRDPGDMIRITSIEGPGTGYTEAGMFIKQSTYDPNTRRVTHLCRDLTDILESFGEWSSLDLTWDTATEQQQAELVFWANDDDLIPTELAPGQEWR